jgi:hypothetical protein
MRLPAFLFPSLVPLSIPFSHVGVLGQGQSVPHISASWKLSGHYDRRKSTPLLGDPGKSQSCWTSIFSSAKWEAIPLIGLCRHQGDGAKTQVCFVHCEWSYKCDLSLFHDPCVIKETSWECHIGSKASWCILKTLKKTLPLSSSVFW